jgi:hypothetical protein
MKFKILIILLAITQFVKSQTYNISGYVEDLKTGERIIGAYVIDSISKKATSSNNFGFYNLRNIGALVSIQSSYVGLVSEKEKLSLIKDTFLIIKINTVNELKEVVIVSSEYTHKVNDDLGFSVIPVKTLTLIPALGEADLLKSIQTQPGIKGGIEGSAGIFVRGGGGGENLFMLDDVPIYNVSHLYGFFSAFNSSAIKDIKLLKGCFPARYGGRTSSVIDIRSLDGNNKSVKVEFSVGLISSKFTLEGPLINDKTTFMVSGRRSYFDLFTEPLKKPGIIDNGFPDYYFYDINARLVHTFSKFDRLYLSFYKGKDYIQTTNNSTETDGTTESFEENKEETSGWGNTISSLRWNHTFGNNLFANTTFACSSYNYFTQNLYKGVNKKSDTNQTIEKNYNANYTSEIKDYILKTDFDYSFSAFHTIKFGAGNTFHTFNPGKNIYTMEDQELKVKTDTSYKNDIIYAHEPYFFTEDNIKVTDKLSTDIGIRYSGFITTNNKIFNIEPRFVAIYMLTPDFAFKTGYTRMFQYMHLISSYGVSMPTDIWVPAVKGINPLKSDQVNIGAAYNLEKIALFSVEAYRKWLTNTTDFRNGSSLITDLSPWYTKTTQGTGNTKGIELSIEKQQGCIKGNLSYTLSKADRQYAELNNGNSFPFKYDRLHDFSISVNYQLSEKWDVSAFWVYGSGFPVTLPVEKYLPALGIYNLSSEYGGEIDYYPSRNNYRLPAYHRLDLGFHYKTQTRLGEHALSFDIFNAYNRKNPVYMYYSGYRYKTLKYGGLLPIIPSVTYTFKFK